MLTDNDPMPFGKHKGKKMADVPASYLDWLADQPWIEKWHDIQEYIEDNRLVITMELEGLDG